MACVYRYAFFLHAPMLLHILFTGSLPLLRSSPLRHLDMAAYAFFADATSHAYSLRFRLCLLFPPLSHAIVAGMPRRRFSIFTMPYTITFTCYPAYCLTYMLHVPCC